MIITNIINSVQYVSQGISLELGEYKIEIKADYNNSTFHDGYILKIDQAQDENK